MRKLLSAIVFLAAAGVASAETCLPGTLADYLAFGVSGCDLLTVNVSSFSIWSGQSFATPIDPALVQVTPGGSSGAPNLLFTLNQAATGGDLFELFFDFSVTGVLTGSSIELLSPEAAGNGVVTGVLDICTELFFPGFCSGSSATAIAAHTSFDSQLSDSISMSSSFFDVFVDLTADGGGDGSASLNSSKVSFTALPDPTVVPEPSSILFMSAALGAMLLVRSRRPL